LTVRGAFGVNAEAYIEAIRIIESGRFPLEKMHSGKYELADTEAAIQSLADGDAVHVCVCPEAESAMAAVGTTASEEAPNAG
jgi:Zn-dependent alcohol dehydrogenase